MGLGVIVEFIFTRETSFTSWPFTHKRLLDRMNGHHVSGHFILETEALCALWALKRSDIVMGISMLVKVSFCLKVSSADFA